MRLVVLYYYGDYECSCHNVIPVEYSSAEAFLCDLDYALKELKKRQDNYIHARAIFDAEFPAPHFERLPKHKDKSSYEERCKLWLEKHEQFNKEHSYPLYEEIKLGGQSWYPQHFIEDNQISLPTVLTLDEWFERYSKGEI